MSKTKPAATPVTTADPRVTDKGQSFLLLRSGTARKLGKQSTGAISYQIVTDTTRSSVSIAIVGNTTGGYFSKEQVPLAKIQACIGQGEAGKSLSSKTFKDAFTGRSANNAGFLAAVLRAEGLLLPAAEAGNQHIAAKNWPEWEKVALAETGTLIEPVANTDIAASTAEPDADHKKTLTLPRKKGA